MAALRLRQLRLRGGDPGHGLLEVLRALGRRQRARRGRLLVGALGDDLHGDRRARVAAARRDRRPRGGPEALPRAPDLPLGGRDGPHGDGERRGTSCGASSLAVIATVGFEAAIVYYNAYLPDLADETWRGRLSAYGFATGYAGSALALAAALPFALEGSYGGAFLTAAALFGLFSLPAMLFLPADRPGGLPPWRPCASVSPRRARTCGGSSGSRSCAASSSPICSSRTGPTRSSTSRRCSPATPSASRPPR